MNTKKAIMAALNKRESGFRWLYDNHYGKLAAFLSCAFRLGESEMADVLQDSFFNAFSKLDQLENPDRFYPWLASIAKNCALASIRKNQRQESVMDEFIKEVCNSSQHQDIQRTQERRQLVAVVQDVINNLPENEVKQTVQAYYLDGNCSVDDLAERFEAPRGTITARLKRFRDAAKPKLAARLISMGYGDIVAKEVP
jgi:RNA polymerase sigma-70 factor (ECF subfamily)